MPNENPETMQIKRVAGALEEILDGVGLTTREHPFTVSREIGETLLADARFARVATTTRRAAPQEA